MILLLDLGNSRIKWALAENGSFLAHGAVSHVDDLAAAWANLAAPSRALGCAVSNAQTQSAVAAQVTLRWQIGVQWLQPAAQQGGIRNGYDDPARLGADRWAALFGARTRFPQTALVVVSAGTALVVDALTADGQFLGGMILPGYQLMKQSLSQGTARLPLARGRFAPFPTSTDDAIETGCLSALAGAIAAMVERLTNSGQQSPQIVLSGGDAARLQPLLAGPVSVVDNLALYGLAALALPHEENLQ